MKGPVSITNPDRLESVDRVERDEEKQHSRISPPMLLLSAAQLAIRAWLTVGSIIIATGKGADAFVLEAMTRFKEIDRSQANECGQQMETGRLMCHTFWVVLVFALAVGVVIVVGDKLGAWVWG